MQRGESEPSMKKARSEEAAEMRSEYDLGGAVRGKYAERAAKGSKLVLLDPDVAKVFRDSESVNRALRALTEIVPRRRGKTSS